MKDYITIGEKTYRVEANWNATVAFLKATGKDDITSLATFAAFAPSDLAAMMAACINEGERLEGRESNLTAVQLGEICTMQKIGEFMTIYAKQTQPDIKQTDKPKNG